MSKSILDYYDDFWDLLDVLGFYNLRGNAIDYQICAYFQCKDWNRSHRFDFDMYWDCFNKDYVFSCEPDDLEMFCGFSYHLNSLDKNDLEKFLLDNYDFLKPRQKTIFDFL